MNTVRTGPLVGLLAQLALLAVLAETVGLTDLSWLVGIASGVIINAALTRGLNRYGAVALGPADRITLTRATLAGGVAALTAESFVGATPLVIMVALTVVALVLDAVDGRVARRTGSVSRLGAGFDMEVDAFLILVLSVYVARTTGLWWVLAIGAARYALFVAARLLPWLRGSVPPRYWRKVVAAVQGVVLTIAAAEVLPGWLTAATLAAALALLAESFGRDIWWLSRQRTGQPGRASVPAPRVPVPPVPVPPVPVPPDDGGRRERVDVGRQAVG